MVAGDRAFPINFEASVNSVVVFVVIGISLIKKRKERNNRGPITEPLGTSDSTGSHVQWMIRRLHGLPLFYQ